MLLVSSGVSELRRNSKKYGKAGKLRMAFLRMGEHFIATVTLISFSAAGEAVWFSSDPPVLFLHFLCTGKWFRDSIKVDLQERVCVTKELLVT